MHNFDYASRDLIEEARERLLGSSLDSTLSLLLDPEKYIYVNSLEIVHRCGLSYPRKKPAPSDRFENYGRIVADEGWSKNLKEVRGYALFDCLILRFVDGLSWEASGVYDLKLREIEKSGRKIDGCANKADLVARYKRIDLLFEDMLKNGFKRQVDFGAPANIRNEMFVSIGPVGEFYFSSGGNHRLFISQILRIKDVPFLVMARDEKWISRVGRFTSNTQELANSHPDALGL